METPELEPAPRGRWVKFLVPLGFLAVMAGVLIALLGLVLSQARAGVAAGTLPAPQKLWMSRFALVCAIMLGLTLIVMFWMIVRFVGSRLRKPDGRPHTDHVDAWRLAGQRVKVEDEDEPEELPPTDDDNPR